MKREPKSARHSHQELSGTSAFQFNVQEEEIGGAELYNHKYPEKYKAFEKLDGTHPFAQSVTDGYVLYPVRTLSGGKVTYFNFELAKEMGLIGEDHPKNLSKQLENVLLETFAIRIINEFDIKTRKEFKGERVKPNKYMATRYLQLQHKDKRGRTSGDGRSIWNGTITHKGKTWDVSSRGTGVTILSPGAAEAGKPLKTGGTQFGYGCGLADIDELYGTAIMAEIFHLQGIPTERMLAVIDIGNNLGIGVRAHQNLVRPAHLFRFLKLGDLKGLRRCADYFIDRQIKNSSWQILSKGPSKYDEMCINVAKSFARLVARLDVDYIFVWLDWDGDNILADGSIIDYGSVRQFGLRHDQYRYDDVDRYSTNLNEQKRKAKEIVQSFLQATDFLKTGKKKSIESFASHRVLQLFEQVFEYEKNNHFLWRIGLSESDRKKILSRNFDVYDSFLDVFKYFENTKTSKKTEILADGINKPAIFNMREMMRELPKLLLENEFTPVPAEILFEIMLSEKATKADSVMTKKQEQMLYDLQVLYLELMNVIKGRRNLERFLREVSARTNIINKSDRITGNAITVVVDEIMASSKKKTSNSHIQHVIDHFVVSQVLIPESHVPTELILKKAPTPARSLVKALLKVVEEHREDI